MPNQAISNANIFTKNLGIKQKVFSPLIDMNIFKMYHRTLLIICYMSIYAFCHYSLSYMSLRHTLLSKVQKTLQFEEYN